VKERLIVDKEIDRKFKILFLCTGNSARSILPSFFLRRLDPKHFEVFSAGAYPKGHVNPYVLELLRDSYHIDATSARSKSWEEFKYVNFDFVITVCDRARESCPIWPGQPIIGALGVRGS
jgi:arsenate reductase